MAEKYPISKLYAKLLAAANRDRVNFAIREWFSYEEGADDLKKVIPVLTLRAAANSTEVLLGDLLAFENVNAQADPQRILRYFDAVLTGTTEFNQFTKGSDEMQKWALRHLCQFFPEFDMNTTNEQTGKTLLETAAGIPRSKEAMCVLTNHGATKTDATAMYALEKKCYNNVRHLIPGLMEIERNADATAVVAAFAAAANADVFVAAAFAFCADADAAAAAAAAAPSAKKRERCVEDVVVAEDAPPAKKQKRSFNFIF
jgi:hypothetical protein